MKAQRIRRSREQARGQIIAAVEAALDDMDFGALTVEAVTQRAGMTRSAFYHYFTGLDELVLALLEQFEDEIRASVNAWLEGACDDDDDYRQVTVTHLTNMYEVFETHRKSVGAVAQAASGNRRVFEQWQSRVVDYFIDKTAAFIRRQVKLGRSRIDDPGRVAKALILMNNAVGTDNLIRPDPDDPKETAKVIADIWIATIYERAPGYERGRS